MNARQLILRILETFDRQPTNLEWIIDTMLNRARLDRRDKRFVFEIVYGVIRHRLTLDYRIDALLVSKTLAKNTALRRILQIGMYQILFLDRVPDHAAVNESVKLAKNLPETLRLTGVVNGVLRKVITSRGILTLPDPAEDLPGRLSVEYSHPRWMIERWLKRFGLAKTRKLLSFNNEKPPIFLRRKIRNISRQQFESEVRSLCDQAMGYGNLYYRLKKNIAPENITAIRQGLCTIQAPSSGWVVALVAAGKGEKILDICSSPGGKTAMLSELVGDAGSICACDDRWSRVKLVGETAWRMHLANVHLLVADGRFPPFDGVFDTVLVDAPCSATGVLHRHPDARWTRKEVDIAHFAELQGRLLESAASLVGRGGTVVYSTCSIESEENEAVVGSFLKSHPEFEHAGCPEEIPQTFVDAAGFLSITPFAHAMDGMFGARLKKIR